MSIFNEKPSAGGLLAIALLLGALIALGSAAGLLAWLISEWTG
jgi:hypothetical protein